MNNSIVWRAEAEEELDAASRRHPALLASLLKAVGASMYKFGDQPGSLGESREDDYRVHTILPLTLYYRVDRQQQKIYIVQAVLVMPRPKLG